jgi:hypothetical protein
MENDNTQPPEPEIEVAGSLSDPMTQARLQAVAKAKAPKGIKARHLVKTTETIKVATAFGATSKEIEVEKTVEKTLVGEQDKTVSDTPTEDAMDAEVRAKLITSGCPESELDKRVEEARKLRNALKGLGWSEDIKKTSSADDKFIEVVDENGQPMSDGSGATVNPDAGANGVRIKFTSKPRVQE